MYMNQKPAGRRRLSLLEALAFWMALLIFIGVALNQCDSVSDQYLLRAVALGVIILLVR